MHAMAAKALGIDVQAFASRTVEHAEAKAREFGGRAVAYDQLPAGADIVVVATPPSRHVADALQALAAGAAVLVEKPLATTLADADRLVAADTDGRVAYAENLAHCPAVRAMLGRLGSIGAPSYIEIRTAGPRPTYGEFLTTEWGGGALFDLGAHPIALALLFAGSARVASVTATIEPGTDHRSDEAATVTLLFDTGLRANVIVSWRAELPLWDAQVSGPTGVVRAELLPTASVEHNGETLALPAPSSHRHSSKPSATWRNFARSPAMWLPPADLCWTRRSADWSSTSSALPTPAGATARRRSRCPLQGHATGRRYNCGADSALAEGEREEVEAALGGLAGRRLVIVAAAVPVETMLGRVRVHNGRGPSGPDLLDGLQGDVLVLLPEVAQQRDLGLHGKHVANTTAVVGDRRGEHVRQMDRSGSGHGSTEAVADNADLGAALRTSYCFRCGSDVGKGVRRIERGGQGAALGDGIGRDVNIELLLGAVETAGAMAV